MRREKIHSFPRKKKTRQLKERKIGNGMGIFRDNELTNPEVLKNLKALKKARASIITITACSIYSS